MLDLVPAQLRVRVIRRPRYAVVSGHTKANQLEALLPWNWTPPVAPSVSAAA
jgi:hypothetical protein